MKFGSSLALASLAPALVRGAPFGSNPFLGRPLFVNPFFVKELDSTIAVTTGVAQDVMKAIRGEASAHWLDTKSKVKSADPLDLTTLEGILNKAASMVPPPVTTFIVYDLPNRDCHAHASNGEVCCTYLPDGSCDYMAAGDCAAGIKEYQTEYIDPITEVLARFHTKVPIALIIEPDSLPNLATNLGNPRCGNAGTVAAYKAGVSYAVQQIAAKAPQATMYVDAAHGGWLGWTHSLSDYLDVIDKLNVVDKVRGFALNTANYQPIGTMCPFYDWCLGGKNANDSCCADPCRLAAQYNVGNNELNYALALHNFTVTKWPGFEPRFVIDTGRNGVGDMRKDCSNWCNIRGAGVGHVPTTDTPSPLVDAFMWLKTPGESDGCTQDLPAGGQCKRYDSMCGSEDSIGSRAGEPRAPEAGKWFEYQITQLASLADLHPLVKKDGRAAPEAPAAAPKPKEAEAPKPKSNKPSKTGHHHRRH